MATVIESKSLTADASYNDFNKERFLRTCRKFMKALADALQLKPDEYDLRVNKGGIAVSGEVTLHTDKIYIQASQSSMGPNFGILIRTCNGRKDYSGGHNNFAPIRDLLDTYKMVQHVNRVLGKS